MRQLKLLPTRVSALGAGLPELLRHFPYTEMLAVFIPVYAYAYDQQIIHSPQAVLLVVPFIFAFAAGFTYNDLMDVKDDPHLKRNPLVRRQVSRRQAWIVLGICLTISVAAFWLLYRDLVALIVFGVYLFLCLAYSGLGIRFKEALFGPLVAAFIIWVGGPLIVVLEFHILEPVMIWLLVGCWLVYAGRETLHTIDDYAADRQSGYRTLAVRAGLRVAHLFKNIAFSSGILCLVVSLYLHFGAALVNIPGVFLWIVLLLALVVQLTASACQQYLQERTAYWLVRLFYVVYAAILLQLNPFVMVMLIWVFVTSKRS